MAWKLGPDEIQFHNPVEFRYPGLVIEATFVMTTTDPGALRLLDQARKGSRSQDVPSLSSWRIQRLDLTLAVRGQ